MGQAFIFAEKIEIYQTANAYVSHFNLIKIINLTIFYFAIHVCFAHNNVIR